MTEIEILWLPHCSTCQKAVAFLKKKGVRIGSYRDLKSERLSSAEVDRLVKQAGGAEALFSKRAIKYRTVKLNERDLSEREMIDLMTNEYTFIKRPVILKGDKAIAGFSEKRYEAFLNE